MSARHRGTARILIHVDEERRDVPVLFALGRLFEERGYCVVFSTRRTTASLLRRLPLDAVLVPSLEHIPYDEIPAVSSRCRLFMLPAEGAQIGEFPLLVKYGGGDNPALWERHIGATTRFFLWGEYSRRMLQATGYFRDEQLVVVGAPRMDFWLVEPSPAERARCEPGAIGTVTSLHLTNSYNRFGIFKVIDTQRTGHGRFYAHTRNVEDWYWIEAAWIRVWLELFDTCRQRGERIFLRIHPREDLAAYRYLRDTYPTVLRFDWQEMPYEAWQERLGIVLGYNSTTCLEAVAAGKPAVSLEALLGPRLSEHHDGLPMNHYPIMDHLEAPRSMDELFETIERIRQGGWRGYGPQARALLQEICGFPRSESALAKVVEMVDHDLGGASGRSRAFDVMRATLARARAKALEAATFEIRRDRPTGAWFPLRLRRLARRRATEIHRFVRAAQAFPVAAAAAIPSVSDTSYAGTSV